MPALVNVASASQSHFVVIKLSEVRERVRSLLCQTEQMLTKFILETSFAVEQTW